MVQQRFVKRIDERVGEGDECLHAPVVECRTMREFFDRKRLCHAGNPNGCPVSGFTCAASASELCVL